MKYVTVFIVLLLSFAIVVAVGGAIVNKIEEERPEYEDWKKSCVDTQYIAVDHNGHKLKVYHCE